ncbi:hypothetical protein UYSO10_2002 [Kosakonia radicincitans]|uniref:helix-turn-helix transcriptional regulator n=1 Tax=Kosakonia radicincitans TaxID=283686 RepID=UPI0012526088|nr:AlpA family phage regulatory protein [Kosakonia radicincitans]VVT48070.1 hypothetical protein UYSO10_2002 [Kosakonia radicincitans]
MDMAFWDLNQVSSVIGFGKTKIYSMVKKGEFPKPVKIGRRVRWVSTEVEEWMRKIIEMRNTGKNDR